MHFHTEEEKYIGLDFLTEVFYELFKSKITEDLNYKHISVWAETVDSETNTGAAALWIRPNDRNKLPDGSANPETVTCQETKPETVTLDVATKLSLHQRLCARRLFSPNVSFFLLVLLKVCGLTSLVCFIRTFGFNQWLYHFEWDTFV